MGTARGFTLVELLVVMSIIALLLTIGLSFYGNAQRATRDARRRGDLDALRKSLEIYRTEHGNYRVATVFPCTRSTPDDWLFNDSTWGAEGYITGCASSVNKGLGSYFTGGTIPQDPYCSNHACQSSWNNYQLHEETSDSFVIYA